MLNKMDIVQSLEAQEYLSKNQIKREMIELLQKIGSGTMTSTAYDTAWIARLFQNPRLAPLAEQALSWLRKNQLPDGSWGTAVPVYHHDRVICTLISLIALAERGHQQDQKRIQLGIQALKLHQSKLDKDLAGETIAFEMLIPTLYKELVELDLIAVKEVKVIKEIVTEREEKLARSPGNMISRQVTMAFSSEMAGSDGQRILNKSELQEENGSIAHSPSATAYFLRHVSPNNQKAIAYLEENFSENGAPNVAPFDLFEAAWTLWNFSLPNIDDQKMQALCRPHLDFLQKNWDQEIGIGHASGYTPKDGDDTGFIFEVLTRFDRQPNVDPIFHYEKENHFKCFALESNPSISTNIHILGALRHAGYPLTAPPIQKLLNFLQEHQHDEGYWIDKWHISPYYATSHMIITCIDYCDEVAAKAIDWLLNSQNADGSWGIYQGTAEETAYSLQALLICKRHGHLIPENIIQNGATWLKTHQHDSFPPLWIGKCLYSPLYVVSATILSTLYLHAQELQEPETDNLFNLGFFRN